MNFDDKKFKAISDAAYDPDGIDTNDAAPLDTALHNRIRSNTERMEQGADRVGLHLLLDAPDPDSASTPDGRPIVSVNGGRFLCIPLIFQRSPKKITVHIGADVRAFGQASADMTFTAQLTNSSGNSSQADATVSGASGFSAYRIELEDLESFGDSSATLWLWATSNDVDEVRDAMNSASGIDRTILRGDGTPYAMESASTSGQPLDGASQQDVLVTTKELPSSIRRADHLVSLEDTGDSIDDTMVLSGSRAELFENRANEGAAQVESASFAQIRSANIRIDYEQERLRKSDLRANIVEDGAVMRRHAKAVENQYTHGRLVSIGSGGQFRPESQGWPQGYRSQWTYVDGDSGGELLRESVGPIKDAGLVLVSLAVVPVWLKDPADTGLGQFIQFANRSAVAQWEFSCAVEQLQAGSATPVAIESSDQTREIDHYGVVHDERWPVLSQAYYQRYFPDRDPYAFTYQEGVLSGEDDRFVGVQSLGVEVDASGSFEGMLPFDVKVSASRTAEGAEFFGPRRSEFGSDQYLRLIYVGHSIQVSRSV